MPRKKGRKSKPRPLSEIFPEEWIRDVRKGIADIEEGEFDKPNRTYSNAMKMLFAYKCLADVAIAYAPPKLRSKIAVDAEIVCNKLGTSLLREGDVVTKCLTKKHSDCTGSYYSVAVKRRIICECQCHKDERPKEG